VRQKEFVATLNPSNIKLNLIADTEVRISEDNSEEKITDYAFEVARIHSKYFTKNAETFITAAMDSGDLERLTDVKLRAAQSVVELKKLEVPRDMLMIHKYSVAFFELMQVVIFLPTQESTSDPMDAYANKWYDSAQGFLILQSRLDFELNGLKNKHPYITW
jgi:hypothetical protein